MKRFLGVACAVLILFVNAPMAFAASSSPADAVDTENFDDALEYISSQEVKSQIYNEIDFNKEGTQSIDVGNGIIFKYVYSENVQSTARAYSVKSATMSGHFYLKSNGQKVATYSLAASFHYNGSSVYALESEVQVSSSAISGWSVTESFSISSGSGWTSVDASYQLYHNGNYNNDTFLDMSCDANGNITKNYE